MAIGKIFYKLLFKRSKLRFILFLFIIILLTIDSFTLTTLFDPKSYFVSNWTINQKANATFVILCRNGEIHEIEKTLKNLENVFNKKHNYPYVFINNEKFTKSFQKRARALSNASMEFVETVDESWGYPEWINQTYAAECRDEMVQKGVIYGGSESYRHMCRYFSGFFFRHPAVTKYEYYWRVEPNVKFYCDIDEDPFIYMKKNNKKYGYVITIKDRPRTVRTLWDASKAWAIKKNITNAPLLKFFLDKKQYYNYCHFWSNFEIAKLSIWNNVDYIDYFNHLDQAGGFFYERWGDAPVHSLYVGLRLRKEEIHFFKNIGYKHGNYVQCSNEGDLKYKCKCPENENISERRSFSCHYNLIDYKETPWSAIEN